MNFKMWYYAVLLFLSLGFRLVSAAHLPQDVCTVYNSTGKVYIGGLFSLHDDRIRKADKVSGPPEPGCARLLPVSALQVVEAMVFAVKTVNEDDSLLRNISLGFVIHEDCSRDEFAMWGAVSLLKGARAMPDGTSCEIPGRIEGDQARPVFGIVGTGQTSSSEVVASTGGLFQKPIVSYGATGKELLEDDTFPMFFSTISSDKYKAIAIVDVLEHFDWSYVALVHSTNYDVMELIEVVWTMMQERDLCSYGLVKISEMPSKHDLQNMVDKLKRYPYGQVAVLLASEPATANAVFNAARTANLNLTWVVSGSLVDDATLRDGLGQGSIFIEYPREELADFERYFRSLFNASREEIQNPWWESFCEDPEACRVASTEGFSKAIPTLATTMDAVYALAYALDATIQETHCSDSPQISSCIGKRVDSLMAKNLHIVSFRGARGMFQFKHAGRGRSVRGEFVLRNMQKVRVGVYKMVKIGSWQSMGRNHSKQLSHLSVDDGLIQWGDQAEGRPPRSVCREVCSVGDVEERSLTEQCCWVCRACGFDQIVINVTECSLCGRNEWPDVNRTTCLRLIPKTLTWSDPAAIILLLLVMLGLILCGLIAAGMIRHRNHPLIKASSRELSCVNISGLVLAYLSVLPFLVSPGSVMCGLAQAIYVLSYTLMFAPLLLKVVRIYRIFASGSKSVKSLRFTGPVAQLLIAAALIFIQVLLIFITAMARPSYWSSLLHLYPPQPNDGTPPRHEIFCKLDVVFLTCMSYNIILILICCYFAFRARNVPNNYNEAKFYAVSVYTTLVLIVAAIPVYLTGQSAAAIAAAVSLVVIMDGYVNLVCVYLPKLYAVIFRKVADGKARIIENQGVGVRSRNRPRFGSRSDSSRVHPSAISTIE